ncbi:hypothetical protein [Methylocapsa aurea]|uniref:hypothetical protein n=1 Tax=Methylocapsa aurea TaxID=663610 RepID=UPI000AAB102A|nr:hypothetical protein [Methylocapsa aurea]
MSPLTLFLAKLIGLLFLIFSASMALKKRDMVATASALVRDRGLILLGGSINLIAGLAIVLAHNVWSGGVLTVVVTLVGWLLLLRGVILLFTPSDKLVAYYEAMRLDQNYYVYLTITLVIGLYLSIAGFAG